jgi:hypothetical protein
MNPPNAGERKMLPRIATYGLQIVSPSGAWLAGAGLATAAAGSGKTAAGNGGGLAAGTAGDTAGVQGKGGGFGIDVGPGGGPDVAALGLDEGGGGGGAAFGGGTAFSDESVGSISCF